MSDSENEAPPAKNQKKEQTIAFALGPAEERRILWEGKSSQLHGTDRCPFARITVDDKHYIFKPVNISIGPSKPMGLSLVDQALRLNSSTGVLQCTTLVNNKARYPTFLEAAVAALPRSVFVPEYDNKSSVVFDATAQKPVIAATSLLDLLNAGATDSIEAVRLDSIQRLGLLVLFSRCGGVNNDDILLRRLGRSLELVMGDAKKAFDADPDEPSRDRVWVEEERTFREATPLDEMRIVFSFVAQVMSREDEVEYDSDYGWLNEDGEDRRELGGKRWVRWEARPLVDSVAELIASWTSEEIEAALAAEEHAVQRMAEADETLHASKLAEIRRNIQQQLEGPSFGARSSNSSEWRVRWKLQTEELQKQVRGGARPSMHEVGLMFKV